MKKTFLSAIITIMLMVPPAAVVLAQVTPGQVPGAFVETTGPTTITGWVDVLITVVRWIYTLIFIVAVLFILLAAFNFITSKGDPEKVGTAKSQLLYAIIGIAVALLAYAVVTLVRNSLTSGFQG